MPKLIVEYLRTDENNLKQFKDIKHHDNLKFMMMLQYDNFYNKFEQFFDLILGKHRKSYARHGHWHDKKCIDLLNRKMDILRNYNKISKRNRNLN